MFFIAKNLAIKRKNPSLPKTIVFKNDRCFVNGKPIEQVKDAWRFLLCLLDTIDFYN